MANQEMIDDIKNQILEQITFQLNHMPDTCRDCERSVIIKNLSDAYVNLIDDEDQVF